MKLINGLFKIFYWPVCRAYSSFLGDKPADTLFRILVSFQFFRVYHFWPDLLNPRSFSEKLWCRMLHERNPIFTLISDKLLVRDYVASKVGEKYLIPLLWSGEKPEDIPFSNLPLKYVIKANHGCKYIVIVDDKTKIDMTRTMVILKNWLKENYGKDKFLGIAWGYKNIKPAILIEEFIGDNGTVPLDYKFYCFSGKIEILTIHSDRFGKHITKAYNRNFEPFVFRSDFEQFKGEFPQPSNYACMVKIAETLASEFDFMRVDLYSIKENIYFGELTPYPAGVSSFRGFDIASMDSILGEKWKKCNPGGPKIIC